MNKSRTHYYLLMDGRHMDNMKDACKALNCGNSFFRQLLQRGIVKKMLIENVANSSLSNQNLTNENNTSKT